MPLNINLQQILLHALNFVILFGALYFLLYKPVRDFMDSRKAHYEKMDADAKAAPAMKRSSRAPTRRSHAASARRTKPCSTRWTSAARRPSSRRARSCARRGKMPRASMSA